MSELIISEVMYYVSHNSVTKQDIANQFNRSLSSVKKDFAKFRKFNEDNPNNSYYRLYLAEQEKSKNSEYSGKVKGGLNNRSGKPRSLTLKKTLVIAKYIISSGCTLDTASVVFKIPKSTLHESIERLKDSNNVNVQKIYGMVREIYESNKSRMIYSPNVDLSIFENKIL